jgi:hypothetical protein
MCACFPSPASANYNGCMNVIFIKCSMGHVMNAHKRYELSWTRSQEWPKARTWSHTVVYSISLVYTRFGLVWSLHTL